MDTAKKIGLLLAALAIALGGWLETLPSWDAALLTSNFGPGVAIVGAVLIAWLGQSPRKGGG